MPQSAIKIPQGETGILTIKEPVRIYCRTSGSDTEGDGSIANPFFSIHRAFRFLENYVFVENGRATIDVGPGRFDFSSTCIISDQSGKIGIAGACETYRTLRQVTAYNYSDGSDGITANSVENYMTMVLVDPANPTSENVEGIDVGDHLLIENATYQKAVPYFTIQESSYGMTGGDADKSINALGCYEVHAVDTAANTVTVKHPTKNFPIKCHTDAAGAALASGEEVLFGTGTNTIAIGQNDPILLGGPGFESVGEQAAFDDFNPVGFYGTDTISGTGSEDVLIKDEIRVKVIKSVLKWRNRLPATNGIVMNENASIDGIENIILSGGSCTKSFHEINPIHAATALKLKGNNSIRKNAVRVHNIGFSGWGTALLVKNSSNFIGQNLIITNCGYGVVADRGSNVDCDQLTILGSDIEAIRAKNNSVLTANGAIVGIGGFNVEVFPVLAATNIEALSSFWTKENGKPVRIIHNPSYRYLPDSNNAVDEGLLETNREGLRLYGMYTTTNGGQYPVDGAIVGSDGLTYGVGESLNCPASRI